MAVFTEKTKDLFKILASTAAIVASGVWFLSHQMHLIRSEMHGMEDRLNEKIALIDKRVTVIETVLILQGYPIKNLAVNTQEK